jgi:hypothetical protein
MAHLLVYSKVHGKAKLFLDLNLDETWLTGDDLYALMPKPGNIYPIIGGRTEWTERIELDDKIAIAVDREFLFEPT